ncbi:hypothetical protein [Parapedobacter sp. DT-150]|uniref:hypothetical protein n=1 Tax=Parapedobacter sp. DT-150 TaxID=3396162 RepID=UPI003F1BA6FD
MTNWEQLTDGLQLHEVAMFAFGALLFMVLLFLVVLFALRKRPLKPLLLFFTIPVVMLGWPSVAKIQINAAGVALENNLRNYQTDPADQENQKALEANIEVLETSGVQNPESLMNIARGKYLLGKDREALQTIDKIPDEAKAKVGADELKSTITVTQDIQRKLQQATQMPTTDNLEILRISKDRLVNDAANNVRLRRYVTRSDSLIQNADGP